MTSRIMRIELRRSAAAWIGLLMLVAGAGLLLVLLESFAGRWTQLAFAARSMLIVLLPLALAGGAWLGRRDARSRVGELFASTVRPRWQRVLPSAMAFAITIVSAYVLMLVVGAAWVVPTAGYYPLAAVGIAGVGALSLVAGGWLGLAAGRAVPRLVTAPALAVLGFLVVVLLPDWLTVRTGDAGDAPGAVLLSPTYPGGFDDFQTLPARVNLAQALWLAALAATGLLLSMLGRRTVALAVLPAVAGAAVTVPLMPTGGYGAASVFDREAMELVCDDDGPRVCMTRVHAGLLPDVIGPARQALTRLAAKLPDDAPVEAAESRQPTWWVLRAPAATRQPADTLVFAAPPIGSTGRADLSDASLLLAMVEAAWSQECDENPAGIIGFPESTSDPAIRLAAAWVLDQPLVPHDWWDPALREQMDQAYRMLIALPAQEQARRMSTARQAALDCQPDPLASLMLGQTP
ncbi:hypothetical protein SAMN05443287_105407 [Micromonospora phaseoli]|uniref:ABC-type transport system involved in multi-copper enzyme maturation, permease component n=1 Tax=Micromonospora phaseoli TaxID=1144548 RepID=A0A1H7A0Z5_9ACTN|nr:hypothetical protein [Micromonospora phaseoli]PZV96901.1 hypothetical protein CLV64_1066 [Micromonospora phaseoli]GIJ77877.1 hypothetical protein Xph01_23090 [Micromonospora phaseoli]SEJ59373.1 hypothetical protein SAMN05443287_105407 [Micromonospora phaseoli]